MAQGVFVTGTDTGVGKTVVATALLRALGAVGVAALGMKPVAAGADPRTGRNPDVDALAAASTVDAPLEDRNPYAFREAIAPHVAAACERRTIELRAIADAYARLARRAAAIVVEGAGGPLVPLDDRHDMLDIARTLALPVVLVVGVRLGCLNHARAAMLAIRTRGLHVAGWIATRIDPAMERADESVDWLSRELRAPRLADFATRDDGLPPAALRVLGLPHGR